MTGVFTYLDCSTQHITKKDDELLSDLYQGYYYTDDSAWSGLVVFGTTQDITGGYGYFVLVDTEPDVDYSPSMNDVMALANERGCQYIKLSPDGEIYPHLPQYDW